MHHNFPNPSLKEFLPHFTPGAMLRMGIFGGTCFAELNEKQWFPEEWFDGLKAEMYKSSRYRATLNAFKVKSGQTLKEWQNNGWIHPDDQMGGSNGIASIFWDVGTKTICGR